MAQGGTLAEPRDEAQFGLIQAFSAVANRFWLGGQDTVADPLNQNILFVSDNTPVPLNSGFFAPGEPNNSRQREYCLEFLLPINGLNDESCLTASPYICEFGASGPNSVLC